MSGTMIEEIAAETREASADAERRYAELLQADDQGEETKSMLRELAHRLGKSPEQLLADGQAMETYRLLRRTIEAGAGLEQQRSNAAKAVEKHHEETLRISARRSAEKSQLVEGASELERRYIAAWEATHKLNDLKSSRPDLFTGAQGASAS